MTNYNHPREAPAAPAPGPVPDVTEEEIPSEVQEALVVDVAISNPSESVGSETGMFDVIPCRTDEPAVRLRRRIRRHASLDNNPSSG